MRVHAEKSCTGISIALSVANEHSTGPTFCIVVGKFYVHGLTTLDVSYTNVDGERARDSERQREGEEASARTTNPTSTDTYNNRLGIYAIVCESMGLFRICYPKSCKWQARCRAVANGQNGRSTEHDT